MKKLKKGMYFTDIHFGRYSNSVEHNEDCIAFLRWFASMVKQHEGIDHIGFLGDWFENRSAVNIHTLHYCHLGMSILNSLGLPIYLVVGNHDLYLKNSRDIHTSKSLSEFKHVRLIETPQIVKEVGDGAFFSPFLFHHEYEELGEYLKVPHWLGHFEFKGFVITGHNIKMDRGPDIENFGAPTRIFSGHYHKRQTTRNVTYMGNAFPMDFSDANDTARGCMVYDYAKDEVEFHDWAGSPKYIDTTLSEIIDEKIVIPEGAKVRCTSDVQLEYGDEERIRDGLIEDLKLRNFKIVTVPTAEQMEEIEEAMGELQGDNIDEMVYNMLRDMETKKYKNNLLLEIIQEVRGARE